MKTDVTTYGSFAQSKTPNLKVAEGAKLKDAAKPVVDPKLLQKPNPDYKLDLKTPSTPSPSLPAPSVPTPSLPKLPDLKPTEVAKEAAKDEALEKIKEVKEVQVKEGSVKKPAVFFIKGWDMISSPSKSEQGYAGVGRMAESVEGARLYGWNQKDEMLKEIRSRDRSQPIVLVGHSFGGDTAVEIANDLDSLDFNFRPVDLLVTIDAVGFNNDIIPQNVKKHLNVFGESSWFLNDGPHVARRHEKTKVDNLLSTLDHTDLDDNKEVQYEIMNLVSEALGKKSVAKS